MYIHKIRVTLCFVFVVSVFGEIRHSVLIQKNIKHRTSLTTKVINSKKIRLLEGERRKEGTKGRM